MACLGPDELLAVLGQSIPRAADGGSVCAAAGVAAPGPRDGLRDGPSPHVAGAAAQAGGLGGTVGAPHRAAPASHGALGHDLATSRRGRWRGCRLTTRAGSCRKVAQRDQTGDVCRESLAQDMRRPSDHSSQRLERPATAVSDRDRG